MTELLSVELQPIQVNLNSLGNCCIPFKNEAPHLLFCNEYQNSINNLVVIDTRSGDIIFRLENAEFPTYNYNHPTIFNTETRQYIIYNDNGDHISISKYQITLEPFNIEKIAEYSGTLGNKIGNFSININQNFHFITKLGETVKIYIFDTENFTARLIYSESGTVNVNSVNSMNNFIKFNNRFLGFLDRPNLKVKIYDILKIEEVASISACSNTEIYLDHVRANLLLIKKDNKHHETYLLKDKVPDNACVVCFEPLVNQYALVPCGHTTVCNSCATGMTSCPVCRERVQSIMRIYTN